MTHDSRRRVRGRPFEKGNHGRPLGAKNRKTKILEGLSDEDQRRLLRRAVEVAMDGEPQLLKFFAARMMPKDRLVQIDRPPMGLLADEAADVIAATLQAVCVGEITPSEGAAVAAIANQLTHALEVADIVNRLDVVEAKLSNGRV